MGTIRGRLLAMGAGVLLAACRAASIATPGPTAAETAVTATTAPATDAHATIGPATPMETAMPTPEPTPGRFMLSSSAFVEGGSIPRASTCDGRDTSPPLEWTDVPAGTERMALIVDDPDAGGFVHWVVFDAAPTAGGLPAGITASASDPSQGRNSFGRVGYGGPCPPSGTHHYVFRLLALDAALELAGAPKAGEVLDAARGHILGEARLTATYRRG